MESSESVNPDRTLDLTITDVGLDFSTLRAANVGRCEESFHPLNDWSLPDWATALAGEVGEVCNIVKKLRRVGEAERVGGGTTPIREELMAKLADELADVVIYADLLAARAGIDLGVAVREKFNLVSGGCSEFRL